MKAVLFWGGLGTRLREHSDTIPNPLVNVGYRPVLWHLMWHYAQYGHEDFILCLGYCGDMIREYVLNCSECMSNDFDLSDGGRKVDFLTDHLDGSRITVFDTGLHANLGQRLLRVHRHIDGESELLLNDADEIVTAFGLLPSSASSSTSSRRATSWSKRHFGACSPGVSCRSTCITASGSRWTR